MADDTGAGITLDQHAAELRKLGLKKTKSGTDVTDIYMTPSGEVVAVAKPAQQTPEGRGATIKRLKFMLGVRLI